VQTRDALLGDGPLVHGPSRTPRGLCVAGPRGGVGSVVRGY
jgi:hypothetical protein